jgi:hypothetical protein
MAVESESQILSVPWWDRTLDAWNAAPDAHLFAGIGPVGFIIVGDDPAEVWIEWDGQGRACRLPGPVPGAPRIRETAHHWRDYIDGRFRAMSGVFSRRIELQGDLPRILPYVRAFDRLAEVSRLA